MKPQVGTLQACRTGYANAEERRAGSVTPEEPHPIGTARHPADSSEFIADQFALSAFRYLGL